MNVILDPDGSPSEWQALGDGFGVEVEIRTWSEPDVVQIPTSALFREGEAWDVFVAQGGRARARRVQVGHRGSLRSEIASGLRPRRRSSSTRERACATMSESPSGRTRGP